MKKAIRVTVEYYNVETNEVIESDIIRTDYIYKPEQLKELGYLHSEQIQLLSSIQNFKIQHQAMLCNDDTQCPLCGKKSHQSGVRKSKFHAALTDHEVSIQRRSCRSVGVVWKLFMAALFTPTFWKSRQFKAQRTIIEKHQKT